eukprot:3311745-Pleurochrysis_carterae.AAC.4
MRACVHACTRAWRGRRGWRAQRACAQINPDGRLAALNANVAQERCSETLRNGETTRRECTRGGTAGMWLGYTTRVCGLGALLGGRRVPEREPEHAKLGHRLDACVCNLHTRVKPQTRSTLA